MHPDKSASSSLAACARRRPPNVSVTMSERAIAPFHPSAFGESPTALRVARLDRATVRSSSRMTVPSWRLLEPLVAEHRALAAHRSFASLYRRTPRVLSVRRMQPRRAFPIANGH